jgi:chemotaxis protein methyltransferase CheR
MSAISATDYEFIRQLVYDRSRINLGHDKVELVSSRLRKRLRTLNFKDFSPYLDLLRSRAGEEELTDLLDVISTNVTDFFREPAHFQFLETIALPEWQRAKDRKPGDRFRVWSAACSSGEEPYTLAITLAEYASANPGFDWEITASDLSTRMLDRASEAVYRLERIQLPRPEWLRRYFQRGTGKFEGHARVKNELREKVTFAHQNLMEPYPFSQKFDVIFCRNVMIYFDRNTQETLVPRLRSQLGPHGYLFVGHSESLIGVDKALKIVRPSIYRHA